MLQAPPSRSSSRCPRVLRSLLALALAFGAVAARADVYSDVAQLIRAQQWVAAQEKVQRHLASKPRDPQMRFLQGVIQTETGHGSDAIATFTSLTQDFPELPEPYNNLAALYATEGRLDLAREALETAVRVNPNYAVAHENLGDVYASLAAQAYRKAQQLDAGSTTVPPKLALLHTLLTPAASEKTPARSLPQ